MTRTHLLLASAALALAACGPDFDPASKVDKLRVLAVRAEPPEIAAAPASGAAVAPDRAALTSLVVRGDATIDPSHRTTVVYLACVPTPGDDAPSPCVALASLRDPTAALAAAARASCAAGSGSGGAAASASLAGVEVCDADGCGPAEVGGVALPAPEIRLPAGYGRGFDAFPAGAPTRVVGVEAVALAFAIDATPDELAGASGTCLAASLGDRLAALWLAREHVLTVKRVQIRGPDASALDLPNRNPVVAGIAADGTALAGGVAPSTIAPGEVSLTAVLPAGADGTPEVYTKRDSSGAAIEAAVEEWAFSWFSTAGDLDHLHTTGADAEPWKVPASAAGGRARVVAVVRDLRGGVGWVVRDVEVSR